MSSSDIQKRTIRETFDILGYAASVGAPEGEARTAVCAVLEGFDTVHSASGGDVDLLPRFDLVTVTEGEWQVRVNSEVLDTVDALPIALGILEWRLVSAALEQRTDLFHLHGSALCLPAHRAGLVLVGGPARGKTTLTMGLMLRGFVPFADDVALIDPESLNLRTFRRAFHIDGGTWSLLEKLGPLASQQGAPSGYFSPPQWAEHPVPVRWLLFPEYRPEQTPALIPLTPSEAAAAILDQSLSVTRTPRMALATVACLTGQARCYRFPCGDLVESVAIVQRLVAEATDAPGCAPRD